MGMRRDELANSSILQEGRKEMRLKRISRILQLLESSATRRARGDLFGVKLKRSLQEIAIGINRGPKTGVPKKGNLFQRM